MENGFKLACLGFWMDDQAHDGCWNMAADEMLLRFATVPVLRVYRWSSPAVSVGLRFDLNALPESLDADAVVKRPTGGGVVWHGKDQTFTLMVPDVPMTSRFNPRQSYRWIHSVLARLLSEETGRPYTLVQSEVATGGDLCFSSPVAADVCCEGRKIAGGAQRRTKSGFLHQGSLCLASVSDGFWTNFAEALSSGVVEWRPDEAQGEWTGKRSTERREGSLWYRAAVNNRRT